MKYIQFLFVLLTASLCACNKDNVIEDPSALPPQIILDSDDGVYTVKIGHELTIEPEFRNCDDARITWTLDGNLVCTDTRWTATWHDAGEWIVTIAAENGAGRAEEEIMVECLALTPPIISIQLPENGLKVIANTDYTIAPDFMHDDMEDFKIAWYVDGELRGDDRTFTFNEAATGIYHIKVIASNIDGETVKEFDISVVKDKPYSVAFPSVSYFNKSTERYTFAGRPVFLRPLTEYFDHPAYKWNVDGVEQACVSEMFSFTPSAPGEYAVSVEVSEDSSSSRSITRNVSSGNASLTATVKVICVDATEDSRMRPATASSSRFSNKVYEYTPAPGQFIGDTDMLGGFTGAETSLETANDWASRRLADHLSVSLGAFGGYIIVGFDHSIPAAVAEYDLAIEGNAYLSTNGGSNEPGIVWVMQDVNGNGLPDDEWYELKGSEYDNPATLKNYSVTYFRPEAPEMNVSWVDSEGNSGTVDYRGAFHKQAYYYPAWISEASYTLYGTCIPSQNTVDPLTGYWNNKAYDWGYADNIGSDNIPGDSYTGEGQSTGFKFANAVYADGKSIPLKYVDFVKVQVAVQAKSGALGEVSTEVFSLSDFSMQ